MNPVTITQLRNLTVAHNFPPPNSLQNIFNEVHFIQADPIRSPARAQDLILRHRVNDYHAGDLERLYTSLDIEEDFFVNYGYVSRKLHELMHPRSKSHATTDAAYKVLPTSQRRKAKLIVEFVNERGTVHPREVNDHFSDGKVVNYWGGSSSATTHLMDQMHYHGMLRVVRRDKGIRIYKARVNDNASGRLSKKEIQNKIDQLVDILVRIYAPLAANSLSYYVRRLRYAVPQWKNELPNALKRAKNRLSHAKVDNIDWYWPSAINPIDFESDNQVRLLAPFDPVVHDRSRFEIFWGWVYRFEAYTPANKRKLGYYALPLLWKDDVIGWANLSIRNGALDVEWGFANQDIKPRSRAFKRELDLEIDRVKTFLQVK